MNRVYLDSMIVIYCVEGTRVLQAKAQARIASLRAAGNQFAVSDLTWLECRIQPIRTNNVAVLAEFNQFLTAADVAKVPMPSVFYERATHIRARHMYKLGDSLRLAAAVESGCHSFLTYDFRLQAYPDIAVEILS